MPLVNPWPYPTAQLRLDRLRLIIGRQGVQGKEQVGVDVTEPRLMSRALQVEESFDPVSSDRTFRMMMSDHPIAVIHEQLVARVSELASSDNKTLRLGFRQLDARAAIWRPATSEEVRAPGWWTSPWLQVEAGIAAGLGLRSRL